MFRRHTPTDSRSTDFCLSFKDCNRFIFREIKTETDIDVPSLASIALRNETESKQKPRRPSFLPSFLLCLLLLLLFLLLFLLCLLLPSLASSVFVCENRLDQYCLQDRVSVSGCVSGENDVSKADQIRTVVPRLYSRSDSRLEQFC